MEDAAQSQCGVTAFLVEHKICVTALLATGISIIFLWRYFSGGRCHSKAQLRGKTIIITGANTGIGKETARDLARRGGKVILACRNVEKAAQAAADIQPDSKGQIVVRHLDLSSMKSVLTFANEILKTEDRIDILINNAGLACPQQKTVDGFDMVFASNHLGHFLLTNFLLDKIKKSAPARIINVSSLAHRWGKINWDDLNLEKPGAYSPIAAYGQSKLANILFTRELAKRLKGTGVNSYAVHPGGVQTDFNRHGWDMWPAAFMVVFKMLSPLFSKNSEQGAQTTIYCAVDEQAEHQTGLYYSDCSVKKPASQAEDDEAAKKLWDVSAKMVGL